MSATVAQRPIDPTLFTWPSAQPRLVGSRCRACGIHTFPAQHGCPACGEVGMERTELADRGTVWTWTTQDFLPKAPYTGPETEEDFAGYLVAYVELPGQVRVETRLVDVDRTAVSIGMPVELVIVPFRTDADGVEVLTYAFRPSADGAS